MHVHSHCSLYVGTEGGIFFSDQIPIRFRCSSIHVRMENIRLWQNLILENQIGTAMLFEEANSNCCCWSCTLCRRCSPVSSTRATASFGVFSPRCSRLEAASAELEHSRPAPTRSICLSIKSYFFFVQSRSFPPLRILFATCFAFPIPNSNRTLFQFRTRTLEY